MRHEVVDERPPRSGGGGRAPRVRDGPAAGLCLGAEHERDAVVRAADGRQRGDARRGKVAHEGVPRGVRAAGRGLERQGRDVHVLAVVDLRVLAALGLHLRAQRLALARPVARARQRDRCSKERRDAALQLRGRGRQRHGKALLDGGDSARARPVHEHAATQLRARCLEVAQLRDAREARTADAASKAGAVAGRRLRRHLEARRDVVAVEDAGVRGPGQHVCNDGGRARRRGGGGRGLREGERRRG